MAKDLIRLNVLEYAFDRGPRAQLQVRGSKFRNLPKSNEVLLAQASRPLSCLRDGENGPSWIRKGN